MKKWLFGVVLYSLLLCLCASACADESSVIDCEDFAAYLQGQGITIPKTLEEAIGDDDFSNPPKYELIVDEKNDQYILWTDLGETDANICMFSNDMEFYRDFHKTNEPGVYVAKGIGNHTDLYISVFDEKDPDILSIECYYDLEKSGNCISFLKEYHLTDTLVVSKRRSYSDDGSDAFEYTISKKAYTDDKWYYENILELDFQVPTGELERVAYDNSHYGKVDLRVIFVEKELFFLTYDEYDYSIYDGWEKNGDPCDPPFELTPDLFPYPSFLP